MVWCTSPDVNGVVFFPGRERRNRALDLIKCHPGLRQRGLEYFSLRQRGLS